MTPGEEDEVTAVIDIVRDTERCPFFLASPVSCDGLDGCPACLRFVAVALVEWARDIAC